MTTEQGKWLEDIYKLLAGVGTLPVYLGVMDGLTMNLGTDPRVPDNATINDFFIVPGTPVSSTGGTPYTNQTPAGGIEIKTSFKVVSFQNRILTIENSITASMKLSATAPASHTVQFQNVKLYYFKGGLPSVE